MLTGIVENTFIINDNNFKVIGMYLWCHSSFIHLDARITCCLHSRAAISCDMTQTWVASATSARSGFTVSKTLLQYASWSR